MKKQTKIAVFFGGKISQHLVMLKKAAKKLGVRLDLVSYNRVYFDTNECRVKIRSTLSLMEGKEIKNEGWLGINDYDVLFFRTTGKHWEEVDLILSQADKNQVVVDPIVKSGKPSMACKAYQMLQLKKAGIDIPKTLYGSLWYLYERMNTINHSGQHFFESASLQSRLNDHKKKLTSNDELGDRKKILASEVQDDNYKKMDDFESENFFDFPVIIKGSGGDRGTRVYKVNNLEEMEKLVRNLRKMETEEGKRYMLQEYIENDGDYRVLVLGKKVLGVMKRSSQDKSEFRNNYSAGGKVVVADLSENIKLLAIKAAEVCGLWVAGVDVAFRNYDMKQPVIWEVNKGPQFKGFMEATGIDVPAEMVKFLASLNNEK